MTFSALPDAPQGSVTTLSSYSPSDFPASAAVLCRNGAPLLTFAFALLRRRVACHVLGRDLASGLEKLLDKVEIDKDCGRTAANLQQYTAREVDRLTRKGKRQEAANAEDRSACLSLFLIAPEAHNTDMVRNLITKLFAAGPGVTLSTIHKAKGMEWDTVFFLDPGLIPSRYAEAPWELTQERNLKYVGVTRARTHLRYINSGGWRS